MACESVTLPGGQRAIVCSSRKRQRCATCGRPATLLCDWKVTGNRTGTCDAPICTGCTTSPAPDKDLCPDHATAFALWRRDRAAGATPTPPVAPQ